MKTDDIRNSEIFSIMKALGIICVVAGHTRFQPVHDFVYLFHLAVFYFVAGYFFKEKYIYSKKQYIWKKVKSLWLPLIGYGLFFLAIHNLLFNIHIYSSDYGYNGEGDHLYVLSDYVTHLKPLLFLYASSTLLGALWFIQSIFVTSIAFCIASYIAKKISVKYSEQILGGGILLTAIIYHSFFYELYTHFPFSILRRDLIILPILYCGHLFSLYRHKIPTHWSIMCILFAVLALSTHTHIEISAAEFPNLLLFYTLSLSGCYFIYLLAYYIQQIPKVSSALIYIGKATFEIMALHLLAFKAVNLIQIYVYDLSIDNLARFPVIDDHTSLWWLPYTIVGILLPLLYVWFKHRVSEIYRHKFIHCSQQV